jgi:hypothetical protein
MKSKLTRILALALTVLMVVGVVPMAIFAVDADAPAEKVGKYIAATAEDIKDAIGEENLMFYYTYTGSLSGGNYTPGGAKAMARNGIATWVDGALKLSATTDAGKANFSAYTQGEEVQCDPEDANKAFVYSFDVMAGTLTSGFATAIRTKMIDGEGKAQYINKSTFTVSNGGTVVVDGKQVAVLSTENFTNFAIAVNPAKDVNTYTAYINGEVVATGTFLTDADYANIEAWGYEGFAFSHCYMSFDSIGAKGADLLYYDNVTAYWADEFVAGDALTYTGEKYDSTIKYEDLNAPVVDESVDALGDKVYYYNNFDGDVRGEATFAYTECTENIANGVFAPLASGAGKPVFSFTPAENISGKFALSFDVKINGNRGADPSASIYFKFTSGDSKEWFRIFNNPYGEIHPLVGAAAGKISNSVFTNLKYLVDTEAKTVTLFVDGVATYNGTFNGGDFTNFEFADIRIPGAGKEVYYFDNILLYQYEAPEAPFKGTMKYFNDFSGQNINRLYGDVGASSKYGFSYVSDGRGGYAIGDFAEAAKSDNYLNVNVNGSGSGVAGNKGESFVVSADFKKAATMNGHSELLGATAHSANAGSYGRDFNTTFVFADKDGGLWLASMPETDGIIVNAWQYVGKAESDPAYISNYYTKKIGQLYDDEWTNVAVYCDVENNWFDVYVNGVWVAGAQFLADADLEALLATEAYAEGFGVTYCRFYTWGKVIDNVAAYYDDGVLDRLLDTSNALNGFNSIGSKLYYYEDGFRVVDGAFEANGNTYVAGANGVLLGDTNGDVAVTPYGYYEINKLFEATEISADDIYAIDKVAGKAYDSLEAALAASNNITLTQYTEVAGVFTVEKDNVTIDINGQEFVTEGVAVSGNNFKFVDSGSEKGVIYTDKGNIAITNDAATSVLAYDEDWGGYRVFGVANNATALAVNEVNGRLEFKFRPSLDDNTEFNTMYFANSAAAGLALNIDVIAKDAEGNQVGETTKLVADEELLASVYADNSKVLKVSIGGYEPFASIVVTYTIASASGNVTYSVTYTAPVEA